MAAWLKIDQSLPKNPKTIRLCALRRHKNTDETSGFMQRVWGWVLDAKPDGMIGEVFPSALAGALGVKSGEELLEHLREAGFVCSERCALRGLDPVAHRPGRIHDWDEMSGELAHQRVREAERKRLVRGHDRGHHASGPVTGCPRCERLSAGQRPDTRAARPVDGPLSRDSALASPSMSGGQDRTVQRTAQTPSADASRARAREGDKRERETRQEPPSPARFSGQGSDEELARRVLESATGRWRDGLQALLLGGLTNGNLATWYAGTELEERDGWAIVRTPNAFVRQWLMERHRVIVARALSVEPARVVFALRGETVALEPEPVDDEPPIPDVRP